MSASARLPLPPGIPGTGIRLEQQIVAAVEAATQAHERKEALWELVLFYHEHAKRNDLATAVLRLMIEEFDDPENTAVAYYVFGRMAQAEENWAVALKHYENGLAQLPRQPLTLYFLRNNAGYCLNAAGRFVEGERYCRWAVEVSSGRPDAFNNLAISLYAQGDFQGAAWCWVEALKVDPNYAQARTLLSELLLKHPAMKEQCTWIQQELLAQNSPKLN